MIKKMYVNMLNTYETDMNPDEEMITINKSKLIDYISTLIEVAFFIGIGIGAVLSATIRLLISIFS